jgi:fatty aldehyde-generating acyl-ACP reductase
MGGAIAGIRERAAGCVDFALIGHQESWRAAADVVAVLRGRERAPLPDEEIREIFPWIPSRVVCRVEVTSVTGVKARGLYIDSFLPPDRLSGEYVHENISRMRAAAACAINAGAKIVSLGGFSSILIEGNFDHLPDRRETVFTTGNTLTVGFIVQGVRRMCALKGRTLHDATLLIVGASGDVGSGCARCLAPFVKRTLLHARNAERRSMIAAELKAGGANIRIATHLEHLPYRADIVICAASLPSPSLLLGRVAPGAIICDAGYPKNLHPNAAMPGATIFFGGLGQIVGGLSFTPDFSGVLNRHPFPDVAHGCLLEGMALALERRFEPFSQGRGSITPERVEAIERVAERHGIHLAPLYNTDGPIERLPQLSELRHRRELVAEAISA